jgi:hypothetical protein
MLSLPLKGHALIEEVVRSYPEAVSYLRQHGIVCLQCGEPVWGTLAEVVEAKGLEIGRILDGLNEHLAQVLAHPR